MRAFANVARWRDASEFGPATGEIAFQSEEGAKLVALAAKHHTLPPFAAGVAALIKAANPSLGGRDITSLMQATANGYRGEAADAYEAVLSARGATFTSQFGSPLNGGELTWGIPRGEGRTLTAKLHLHDSCSTQHTIELRVTDSDGNVKADTITVSIYVVC